MESIVLLLDPNGNERYWATRRKQPLLHLKPRRRLRPFFRALLSILRKVWVPFREPFKYPCNERVSYALAIGNALETRGVGRTAHV